MSYVYIMFNSRVRQCLTTELGDILLPSLAIRKSAHGGLANKSKIISPCRVTVSGNTAVVFC